MSSLERSLTKGGYILETNRHDTGHVRIFEGGKKVGEFVRRDRKITHFEIHGRVRDWFPNADTYREYRERLNTLIGWAVRR